MTAPSRWSVVGAFALVGAATQLLWLTYAGVTTVTAARYGVSEGAVGWLAQVFPLLYVVLAIPAGMALDRWFRGALALGAVLTAAGAALRLAGDGFGWVLAGQLLIAVAQPLVLNAVTGVAGRYLAERDRPTGIAVGTASTFAGMVLAFVLAALLPGADQLDLLSGIGAAFSAVAAAALLLALRRPGEHRPDRATGSLRATWGDGFVRRLCALVFVPFGVFIALTTYAQPLLEPAGVDGATASVMLLLAVVAGVLGCAVLPVLAARTGRELALMTAALVATAVACAGLALLPGPAAGFVALPLVGFALLPALPVVLDLAARRGGDAEGTAAGLVWLSGNLGGLVVGAAVGLLLDRPVAAFLLLTVLAAVALPLVRTLRRDLPAPVAARST